MPWGFGLGGRVEFGEWGGMEGREKREMVL